MSDAVGSAVTLTLLLGPTAFTVLIALTVALVTLVFGYLLLGVIRAGGFDIGGGGH
jgi:hypothetical protein